MSDTSQSPFVPGVDPPAAARDADNGLPVGRCFAFAGSEILVIRQTSGTIDLPGWEEIRHWSLEVVRHQYLGVLYGEPCWSVELAADAPLPAHVALSGLRSLFDQVTEAHYAIAGRAFQIIAWERDHQFCGRCGTRTEAVSGERARRCPACGLVAYPRISPAIIVLIERGDHILLARGRTFAPGRYGIVAGFVEPGESLEEAVRREVREEVDIELGRIDYFGSQPWPFPHGIMIGFRAQHERGEITIDEGELAEAGWYSLENLPQIPPRLSIARRLIDDWAARRGAVIAQP